MIETESPLLGRVLLNGPALKNGFALYDENMYPGHKRTESEPEIAFKCSIFESCYLVTVWLKCRVFVERFSPNLVEMKQHDNIVNLLILTFTALGKFGFFRFS